MPGWKVVRFTMPALAFACILLALAPNVAVLVAALYLLRLFGQGMMTETALTEVGRWFVASRGRALALIVQGLTPDARSEERRVGQAVVRRGRCRGSEKYQ